MSLKVNMTTGLKKYSSSLLCLFTIAMTLRVLFALFDKSSYADDDGTHTQYALNFLQGKGWLNFHQVDPRLPILPFRAWIPPLYPLLIVFYKKWVASSLLGLRVILGGFGSLTCVVTALLGRYFMGRNRGTWAGWGLCFYPAHIFWSTRLLPESAVMLFSVIAVLSLLFAHRTGKVFYGLVSGLCFALATLGRGEFFFLVFVSSAWFIWREFSKWRLLIVLSILGGFILTMAPWIVRNSLLFGRLLLTTTNYGDGFLIAHSDTYALGHRMFELSEEQVRRLRGLGELQIAEMFFRWGLDYIYQHPFITICATIGNFLVFWRPTLAPAWDSRISPGHMPWRINIFYTLFSFPLLVFFLNGVQDIFKTKKATDWSIILWVILYKSLIQLPYYMVNRFREAISPFIMLIAVLGFFAWFDSRSCESR